jgi:hypothetical protein
MKTTNLQLTDLELKILFRAMTDKFDELQLLDPKFKTQDDLICKIAMARKEDK